MEAHTIDNSCIYNIADTINTRKMLLVFKFSWHQGHADAMKYLLKLESTVYFKQYAAYNGILSLVQNTFTLEIATIVCLLMGLAKTGLGEPTQYTHGQLIVLHRTAFTWCQTIITGGLGFLNFCDCPIP